MKSSWPITVILSVSLIVSIAAQPLTADPASHLSAPNAEALTPSEYKPVSSGEVQLLRALLEVEPNIEDDATRSVGDWDIRRNVLADDAGLRLAGFEYPDFSTVTGLTFNGATAQYGDRLRLTPSSMYQTGSVWYTAKQAVRDGFESTFQFQITDVVHDGSDGFTFIIQNDNGMALGSGGGSLGYAYIRNSVVVEFDTYESIEVGDPNNNHLSVQTRGQEPNDADHAYSLGSTIDIPDIRDGYTHTATVRYEPGILQVFIDEPSPVFTVSLDLSTTLALDEGHAWVGFSATTGGAWENHDILSWSFESLSVDPAFLTERGVLAIDDHINKDAFVAAAFSPLRPYAIDAPPLTHSQASSPSYSAYYGATRHLGWGQPTSSIPVRYYPDDIDDIVRSTAPESPPQPEQDVIDSPDMVRSTIVVTSTADDGPGSLRVALASASSGDTITFDPLIFDPAHPMTIALASPLPEITQGSLIVDASDAGVVLDGSNLSSGSGFRITSDRNIIQGLQIVYFPWSGIELTAGASENLIGGDWTVGNAPHGHGNIITLNGENGIDINGADTMSNTVSGNLIGLDLDGTEDIRVQAMVVSPAFDQDQTLFIGTPYHGVLKSTDGGDNWEMVNQGLSILNVLDLAISPNYDTDRTLFASTTQGAVFKTVNGGVNWTRVDGGAISNYERKIIALAISPDYANDGHIYALDDEAGLFLSTDGGASWIARNNGFGNSMWDLQDVTISPDYPIDQTVFAFTWIHVFKSVDQGANWITITENITSVRALAVSPDFAHDQTVFLGLDHCEAESRPVFWQSVDGGGHWIPISGTLWTCGIRDIVFSPNYASDQTLFAGDSWGGVYRSTDGGATWPKVRSSRLNWRLGVSAAYASDQTIFVGQRTGEISVSTDGGTAWERVGTGLTRFGNYDDGIRVWGGAQYNIIGGASDAQRNVISNNGLRGVAIFNDGTDHNVVIGNYIGTDASGALPLGNDVEGMIIQFDAQYNSVGGGLPGEGNVIAGNGSLGIGIWDSGMNTIRGNLIGVNASGTIPLGNVERGIALGGGACWNHIGGTTIGERNIISGNGEHGIGISDRGTENNTISGNYIGTDISGTIPLGNCGDGIALGNWARFNQIGGTTLGERNVIVANGGHGIGVGGENTTHNVFIGNYIGVDVSGNNPLGNDYSGIGFYDGPRYNRVGGASPAERNVISGNGWDGVTFWGAATMSNTISGNYIGTNAGGTAALGNHSVGVGVRSGAKFNQVGGAALEGNVISGNGEAGVGISGIGTVSNTISGNYIGVNANGTAALGNRYAGVSIDGGAQYTRVGCNAPGMRNIISGNGENGVTIGGTATTNNVVVGNYIGLDATGTYTLGNVNSGVIIITGAYGNVVGGTAPGEGNVISGNSDHGVGIWDSGTVSNVVVGNFIGTDPAGMTSLGNSLSGIVVSGGAQFNRVGGYTSAERNVISGNGENGIAVWEAGTSHNTIIGNYVGIDADGLAAVGNQQSGIILASGAQYNRIGGATPAERNVFSGNGWDGVGLQDAATMSNTVSSNYIGTNANGTAALGNVYYGIAIWGAQGNQIGGSLIEGNLIGGNGQSGIAISSPDAMSNTISGNYIGVDASGAAPLGNQVGGIIIGDGARFNRIGGDTPERRNVIGGNGEHGILVWGSEQNTIIGNYVGLDASGQYTVGNTLSGIVIADGCESNSVGGSEPGEGNVVSGNGQHGIGVWGTGTISNVVVGNFVGTDYTGAEPLGNTATGVVVSAGAQFSRVERNVVSGNGENGIALWDAGTSYNIIIGNYVGTNAHGLIALGNHSAGIVLSEGAQFNRVGGTTPSERNVISGNYWDGVGMWRDAISNTIIGNYIGTDRTGTRVIKNYSCGVGLRDGPQFNIIGGETSLERNVISGNQDGGVCLAGPTTVGNTILGNHIGADPDGALALGNRYGISCIWDAQYNTVERNLIVDSVYDGIRFNGCDRNRIVGNYIGAYPQGSVEFGNGENGISLVNNAQQNIIGPGNWIANNQVGVTIWDTATFSNTITRNAIYDNFYQGIDLGGGGNDELPTPVLISATTHLVSGIAPMSAITVEIFSDKDGQGYIYEGTVLPNADGTFTLTQPSGFAGPHLTAVATDAGGNSSEFSVPVAVPLLNCLSRDRYNELKAQATAQYTDDLELRIGALIAALDQEWDGTGGTIGLEWTASVSNPQSLNFGPSSVVWTSVGGLSPAPDPTGLWMPEVDFHLGGWGAFQAIGSLQMSSSGRSARLCSTITPTLPAGLSLSHPMTGVVGTSYVLTAAVDPPTATTPITFTWQTAENSPLSYTDRASTQAIFAWSTPGVKTVTVTASYERSTVTETTTMTIYPAPPLTLTGYAISTLLAPEDLYTWESFVLTASIPTGTSMSASVLDIAMNPVYGFTHVPVTDGVTVIDLSSISPVGYSALRLRVDLTSTVPSISPELVVWEWIAQIGDAYEFDDTCARATSLPTDGTVQQHTFHTYADTDWAAFNVISGATYLVQAVSTSPGADLEIEIHTVCDSPILTDTNPFGNDARLVFTAPSNGTYYVKAVNHNPDVYGLDVTYDLSVRTQGPGGVVLIVAGNKDNYSLQDNILYAANLAYRTFLRGGIAKTHIRYLSVINSNSRTDADGDGISDVYASSSPANVESAITTWAAGLANSETPFYVYMVDHGNIDIFYSEGDGNFITPSELDGWLDTFESATGAPVSVIYEACHSGSFIDFPEEISEPGRVVIASTGRLNDAYAAPGRGAHFSDAFFTAMGQNADLWISFRKGVEAVEATMLWQTPWLDDNGDGVPNTIDDGTVAQQRGLISFSFSDGHPPVIDAVQQPAMIQNGEGIVRAQVRDDGNPRLVRVWADVYSPSFVAPEPSSDGTMPDLSLPQVVLSDGNLDGEYVGVYEGFVEEGVYRLVFYAEDGEGNLSQPVVLQVQTGQKRIYLPLVVCNN